MAYPWQGTTFQWWSPLDIDRGLYSIPTLEEFALDPRYLYREKLILIDALESWLRNFEETP
jgi:hypothetical protein